MATLLEIRRRIRDWHLMDESTVIANLVREANITTTDRARINAQAVALVKRIRRDDDPGLMEIFLTEYGLSSDEGVALMCLAEALLRVPDEETMDDLIEDKIAPSSWGLHLGRSSSPLVNASTWALMLTGKVLDNEDSKGISGVLHHAIKRLGEPVIRLAVKRAMAEMGNQFVLGETVEEAIKRGASMEEKGYTYSYDMLGEAALTATDANDFYDAYRHCIGVLSGHGHAEDIPGNPGISVKLSALHPRYEVNQRSWMKEALVERVVALALMAKQANMGFNIDAEESERLDISLDIIEEALSDPRLTGWDGFGIVVQAYSKRAMGVLDWWYKLAGTLNRRVMVRLVKGAYWDREIKRAQVEGLEDYPVYRNKAMTDVAYICCARKLMAMSDRIYPQFATHNAHTVAAVMEIARSMNKSVDQFEFQRLHGMGEALHRLMMHDHGSRCRIYAPVGTHQDLLAYLVRRLLENGANSSFVNQIVDEDVTPEEVASDPFTVVESTPLLSSIALPENLFGDHRRNSRGWDIDNEDDRNAIDGVRERFGAIQWRVAPLLAVPYTARESIAVSSPGDQSDRVGDVIDANIHDAMLAIDHSQTWQGSTASERGRVLVEAAQLYEANFGELFAVLTREAGKTPKDAVAELREAVDFLRYYGGLATEAGEQKPLGRVVCISPWNFPLAIFTGQIAAALAAGNGVLAKPAESTAIVASLAVELLHRAGVPRAVLQLVPGEGAVIGSTLVSDSRINGVCFTGSTQTAQAIHRQIADHLDAGSPLIAETGGINAMIVDSTALPEQAVKDIITSAFQSAGQRCSALRLLYLQTDIAEAFESMLFGAMDQLVLGDPWYYGTDVGPVISEQARDHILNYIDSEEKLGNVIKQTKVPDKGWFVPPTVIRSAGLEALKSEIFGPVLHIATFEADEIDRIIETINDCGYGLTFGLHSRIDDRVDAVVSRLNVGNMYINRNQIGAVVGSQPFGGEGLSGTGPKAGGPSYMSRFYQAETEASEPESNESEEGLYLPQGSIQIAIDQVGRPKRQVLQQITLPGPTGESNQLSIYARGLLLCLGPGIEQAQQQAEAVLENGCTALIVCPHDETVREIQGLDGALNARCLETLQGFDGVVFWGDKAQARRLRKALARRDGAILPLIVSKDVKEWCHVERHVCIDTTASGGNASLLAQS